MNKNRFTIYGCCVTRDIFNFLDNEIYEPTLTIEFNPISALYGKRLEIDKDDICVGSSFENRMIYNCFSKEAITLIKEIDTEYFIFDLAGERLPIQTWSLDGVDTNIPVTWNTYNAGQQLRKMEKYKDLQINNWHLVDSNMEKWKRSIERFCNEIIKKYPPEKIIYISLQQVDSIIDKDFSKILSLTSNEHEIDEGIEKRGLRERQNKIIRMAEKMVLEKIPGCWVISMPSFAMANMNHHFGSHPLHFDYLLYEYYAEALKLIVKCRKEINNWSEIKKIVNKNLQFLLTKYSSIMYKQKMILEKPEKTKVQLFGSSGFARVFGKNDKICLKNPICNIAIETLEEEKAIIGKKECNDKLEKKEELALLNDINKKYYDILKYSNAEWIVIDFLGQCIDRIQIEWQDKKIQIMDKYSTEAYQLLCEKFERGESGCIKKIYWRDLIDLFETKIRSFVDIILTSYKPENIVINEAYYHEYFVDQNLSVFPYDIEIIEKNKYLSRCYQMIYQLIPQCKRINIPGGGISFSKNMPSYITKDEEAYYINCLDVIIEGRMTEIQGLYLEQTFTNKQLFKNLMRVKE